MAPIKSSLPYFFEIPRKKTKVERQGCLIIKIFSACIINCFMVTAFSPLVSMSFTHQTWVELNCVRYSDYCDEQGQPPLSRN